MRASHHGKRVHQARLPDSRNAFQQYVPSREQARHRPAHRVVVPDDPSPDFLDDPAEALPELVDGLCDGGGSGHCLRAK